MLHEKVVLAGTPIHLEIGEGVAGVLGHGERDIGGLERDGLQRGPDEVGAVRAAGEAGDDAAGAHVPVGRAEADKRGDNVDATGVGHLRRRVCHLSAVQHDERHHQPLLLQHQHLRRLHLDGRHGLDRHDWLLRLRRDGLLAARWDL